MRTKEELKYALIETTRVIKDLNRQKKALDFKYLTEYSKELFKEQLDKATSDQIDIICEISELPITEQQKQKLVKSALK